MKKKNGFGMKEMAILMGVVSLICIIAIVYLVHLYDGGLFRW